MWHSHSRFMWQSPLVPIYTHCFNIFFERFGVIVSYLLFLNSGHLIELLTQIVELSHHFLILYPIYAWLGTTQTQLNYIELHFAQIKNIMDSFFQSFIFLNDNKYLIYGVGNISSSECQTLLKYIQWRAFVFRT